MKITIDTETSLLKYGSKTFDELDLVKKTIIESELRKFLVNNTKMSDYEEDCMWMSYRYCIGRHTIASHMHANDIWQNCKGRMSKERQLFTAFDINREIEHQLTFGHNFPSFYFPITSLNRIYSTAVDIVCEFIEEFDIKSEEDLCKYKDVHIKLYDNVEGYTFEVTTWEEWLRPEVHSIVSKYYDNFDMSEDFAWKYFESWKSGKKMTQEEMIDAFKKLTINMPNKEHYYMHDFEDLFVWNDLVHCFDFEHHHKSILTNGDEVEWFWSYIENTEKHDDGLYYRSFGYHKVRVPVSDWSGNVTKYIPEENIKEDIY